MARSGYKKLDRDRALGGRPFRLPVVRTDPRADGGILVTVMLQRTRWQRWLGGGSTVERTFGLDPWGRQVYEACDGRTSIGALVRRLAAANRFNQAEAELAVTTFLKTLMAKGLIAMEVDRRLREPKGGRDSPADRPNARARRKR